MAIPTGALAATVAAVKRLRSMRLLLPMDWHWRLPWLCVCVRGAVAARHCAVWRSDGRFQRVFHWYSDAYLSWFLDSATKVIAPKHKKSRKPPLTCPPQRLWQFSPCNSLLRQYFCRDYVANVVYDLQFWDDICYFCKY